MDSKVTATGKPGASSSDKLAEKKTELSSSKNGLLDSSNDSLKQQKPGEFIKSVLGSVPDYSVMFFTPDKRHVIQVQQDGSSKTVFYDGQPLGPEFSALLMDYSFVASSTGLRTAYAVGQEDPSNPCVTCGPQGKWHAVIDGVPSHEYDKVIGLSFSPDERHVAFAAITKKLDSKQPQSKDEWAIVVDRQETPIPYEALSYKSPAYTPDGRLVYIAKKGDKAVVVVDGKEQQAYDKIGQAIPIFSEDGRSIAYSARNMGSPEVVILNGKAGPGFDYIPPMSLVFSHDGRLAYGARYDNQMWSVVVDGKLGRQYDQVDKIVFSPKGDHFAYNAQRGSKWYLVVDGREVVDGELLSKGFAVFSPDGTRIAHAIRQNGKWKVIVVATDDSSQQSGNSVVTIGEEYNSEPALITFSPDSLQIAFVASSDKKQSVILNGKSGPEFDVVKKPTFSPDSQRFAYEATHVDSEGTQGKGWLVMVDGQPQPQFDGLIPGSTTFSADSKHLIYTARKGRNRLAVIDGRSSSPYEAIYSVLRHSDSGFELLVNSDGELNRIRYEPPQVGEKVSTKKIEQKGK
jgi:DNA-binding beta-propeller fold protein YncE